MLTTHSHHFIWSTKMKTLYFSRPMGFSREGYSETDVSVNTLKELGKKDANALLFIQ
jgi:hypothetical protein